MSISPTKLLVYDQPHQFEPLLPQKRLGELVEATADIVERSHRLQAAVSPAARDALREVVRSMNSYYSNSIEGQGTHPLNIERALRDDFSAKPEIAQRQRIALAHIQAESELEQQNATAAVALGSGFLMQAHAAMYKRLSEADRSIAGGHVAEPGKIRDKDVTVGRHQPPTASSLPLFLKRMDEVYGRLQGLDAMLYTIAAAHHRAAWVHPFLDGNGRAMRLQTHCALHPLSGGLWSVNRGLARKRDKYYELLSNADMPRHGDLDGRGNLSEKMLWAWCRFFIELCSDQVSFMAQMLDLDRMKERIRGLVIVRSHMADRDYREEAVLPLQHVLLAGPVSRGEFAQMTGLGERTARKLISCLVADGLLVSDTPRGNVRLGLPLDALNHLLPNLYPEAAAAPME